MRHRWFAVPDSEPEVLRQPKIKHCFRVCQPYHFPGIAKAGGRVQMCGN